MFSFLFEKPPPPTYWMLLRHWLCGFVDHQVTTKMHYMCIMALCIVFTGIVLWRRRRSSATDGRPAIAINNTLSTGDCHRYYLPPGGDSQSASASNNIRNSISDPAAINNVVNMVDKDQFKRLVLELDKELNRNDSLKQKISALESKIELVKNQN